MNRLNSLNRINRLNGPPKQGGVSWSSYWTTRGVTPGADATLITTELNTALANYGHVKITEAGTYDIDGTIYIPSNTTLEFVAGCTLRKETGSSFYHMIANENIQTLTSDTNVSLTGNGLICDINGIDGVGTPSGIGLRGQIMFYQVTGLTITGIKTTTIGTNQFFAHVAGVTNVIMRDIDAEGDKDGIHFGVADNVLLEDIRTATYDDGIALNARDYAVSNPTVGNITNVTIRRWTDDVYAGQGGSGCLLLSGSWADWTTATDYLINDLVVNAGNIYQKTSAGTQTSANAPIHTSGSATGADDITWKWLQTGTIDHADVVGVTFEDCVWASGRRFIRTAGAAVSDPMRTFFPGTGVKSIVDDIIIDNLTFSQSGTTIFALYLDVDTGTVEFRNCNTSISDDHYLIAIAVREETFIIDKIIINGCSIDLEADSRLINLPGATYDYTINEVSIIGNSDIRTDDSTRSSVFPIPAVNALKKLTLEDTRFHHLIVLFSTVSLDGVATTITALRCTFDEACERLIHLFNTANSTVTFTATDCAFEETTLAMFENNTASSSIVVVSTGSTGESIPTLNTANVDVTGSDLVLALGENILANGKFRENVTGWTATTGAVAWDASECAKFTASGAGAAGMYRSRVNPLSNYVRLTFKAKSPTLNVTMRSAYNPNTLIAVTNPSMTTEWQTYVFEGDIGNASGSIYILSATNLSNGDIIYIDDVTVVQYVP